MNKRGVSSYTKKLSVASSYSEGKVSIKVKATPKSNNIVLDLEFFAKQLKKNNLDIFEDDIAYMVKDKEVIIIEPIPSEIIFIKGKF